MYVEDFKSKAHSTTNAPTSETTSTALDITPNASAAYLIGYKCREGKISNRKNGKLMVSNFLRHGTFVLEQIFTSLFLLQLTSLAEGNEDRNKNSDVKICSKIKLRAWKKFDFIKCYFLVDLNFCLVCIQPAAKTELNLLLIGSNFHTETIRNATQKSSTLSHDVHTFVER